MSFLQRLRTPIYKNTGSTARDHLASERTYLSWLRSGLGFIALGIAIERFSQLDLPSLLGEISQNISSTPQSSKSPNGEVEDRWRKDATQKEHLLVGALLGTGGGSIVYGTARYFSTMRMLERGQFKPAYFGAAGLSVLVAGIAGGVYVQAFKERIKARDKKR
ncbi:hypothetical protein P154DRAFT_524360 [Amniculicola lignicola CBS 123094]|uniref:DUF202 domain-containing protein n=1 Tax=Amniculicola lignicola CBS 123094 TaxID=1392246 RepID=A0A6A5W9H3_9PLEO|nr:hypothetical protein P154DRAFT_524360 [Amniculicola lignicola CBS 123094]